MIAPPDVGESGTWSSVIALTIGILVVLLASRGLSGTDHVDGTRDVL